MMLFTDDERFHTTRAAASEKSGRTQMECMQFRWSDETDGKLYM